VLGSVPDHSAKSVTQIEFAFVERASRLNDPADIFGRRCAYMLCPSSQSGAVSQVQMWVRARPRAAPLEINT
jgi:hypothetical protein